MTKTKFTFSYTYIHTYIYIYIYILILATSHKVTKTKFLIKPKQLNQRFGQLVSQKSHLWLIIGQKLVFIDYSHNSVLTSYCPGPTVPLYFFIDKTQKKKKKVTNTSLKPVHTITKSHKIQTHKHKLGYGPLSTHDTTHQSIK